MCLQIGVIEALFKAIDYAVTLRKRIEDHTNAHTTHHLSSAETKPGGGRDGGRGDGGASDLPPSATLEQLNRVVYACLSTLALLAVDRSARQAALRVSRTR